MLEQWFETVLGMSLMAVAVILPVLLARLILRGAPRVFSYALWAVVLARLLVPFMPESPWSVVPSARLVTVPGTADTTAEVVQVETGIDAVDDGLNGFFAAHPYAGRATGGSAPANKQPGGASDWRAVPAIVWSLGGIGMLIYSAVSLLLLRRRLVGATPLEGEPGVWLADHIDNPFVLGFFRPKIYLPSVLPEGERGYVLVHERTHIRRLDHVTRALAWLALCLHWFNPLVWLAFRLAGRDMETSCDEAALRRADGDIRADYAASLLRLSAGRRLPVGPLAFGEGDMKSRVKNVLSYKKPALWVILTSLIAVAVAAAALITGRPFAKPDSPFGGDYRALEYIYMDPGRNGAEYEEYTLTATGALSAASPTGGYIEIALEPVSPHDCLGEYRHKEYWTGGRDLTVSLRRNNYAAWRGIQRNDDGHDNSFWYLFQQKDGSLYLASGWYDAEGETDPASDDSSLYWIALLTEAEVQNGGTNAGSDSAAIDLSSVGYQLDGNGRVTVTGLKCGRHPIWCPPGYEYPDRPQGHLFAETPFFLNGYFQKNNLEMVLAYWTDASETAIRVDIFSVSSNLQVLSAVPADFTVDLTAGTAAVVDQAPRPSDFGKPHSFTQEEMVAMGRALADLIRGAEEYYAANSPPH